MYTQIKLRDGHIWHAQPAGESQSLFRLSDTPHNRELWRTHATDFAPGVLVPRSKAVIVGHIHTLPEQLEIERLNHRRAQRRNETIRASHFTAIGVIAHANWARLGAL